MTTSTIGSIQRFGILRLSFCAAITVLGLSACQTDSNNQVNDTHTTPPPDKTPLLASNAAHYSSGISNPIQATTYMIGAGLGDITGAAAETGMFGYASGQTVEGINDRLYSHAYIIGAMNNDASDLDKRVVFVSADMGAMFTSVKLEVIKRLQAQYGDLYTDDNVMLTATHTHVGNAGYSHQQLYQTASNDDSTAGYSTQNFNAIVDGIVASITKAHDSLQPGTLTLAQDELYGVTLNRSIPAYNKNSDASDYDSNVNNTMTQLRLDAIDGTPIGLINWFAIHPTSFSNQFMHLSADNKGFAQLGAQKLLDHNHSDDIPFVAAFANADSGDVISAGGNANSAPGYEGHDHEHANVIRDGQAQLNKALELWNKGEPVTGAVDYRARWIDLEGYQVDAKFTDGAGTKVLCTPARGYSFAAGGENGPSNIPGMYEGMTKENFRLNDDINKVDISFIGGLTRSVFGIVSTVNQDECQTEKEVLLPTGAWGWINTEQPVQLMRIGNLAIVSIPGEPTTMAGRRLQDVVANKLASSGVDTVIVNGLANNYSGYLATREEYSAQHYEGASTEYGPYQTNAYIQEYSLLADAMRNDTEVYDTTTPPDRSNSSFTERTGVLFDDKPIMQTWGQVLSQPQASYQLGDTVTAVFRSAHPKNNLRTDDTFLIIQRLKEGEWVDYLTDRDFDTTYTWQREGVSYSKALVDWRIGNDTPAGTYRIVHNGDWKSGWTYEVTPFTGISDEFQVL